MNFDCIIANPPYAKIGCDITRNVIEQNPDSNYAMLGTRSMFKKYYDKLACQYAIIGKYLLGTNENLHWVEQAILLATNGWTEVVDNRKKKGNNVVQMSQGQIPQEAYTRLRNAHLVGVGSVRLDKGAFTDYRTSHLVGAPVAIERAAWNHRTRSTTLVQVNKSVDAKLRNGYIYVSFDTFEEACECAIDIISWTDPTDSHYRCVRWGFVCGLIPHERFEK